MKNVGTEYMSTERKPRVLPEMAELLPPLPDEQLSLLEADILKHGCYSPIVVMEDMTIVDGHNRQSICEKHGIPYRMAVFSFENLLEAKQWALDTQKARRNLTTWELGQIALKLKPEIEARAKERLSEYHGNQHEETGSGPFPISEKVQNGEKVNTTKHLSTIADIGHDTMNKIIQIDEKAPTPIKEALNNKEISVNKGYEITRQIKDLPEDEREAAAVLAIELHKAEKEYQKGVNAVDNNTKIAKSYSHAFENVILLDVSERNVRTWIEWCGIRKDEIRDMINESKESIEKFSQIVEILEGIYEKEVAPYEHFDEDEEDIAQTV